MQEKTKKITMRQARALSELSQQDVANTLGVHRQTVGKWERDASDMPLKKAHEFASLVKIEVDNISFIV